MPRFSAAAACLQCPTQQLGPTQDHLCTNCVSFFSQGAAKQGIKTHLKVKKKHDTLGMGAVSLDLV